jgi:hypothetical protein
MVNFETHSYVGSVGASQMEAAYAGLHAKFDAHNQVEIGDALLNAKTRLLATTPPANTGHTGTDDDIHSTLLLFLLSLSNSPTNAPNALHYLRPAPTAALRPASTDHDSDSDIPGEDWTDPDSDVSARGEERSGEELLACV